MVGFRDRDHAGDALARALLDLELDLGDAVVLALPRGGVPVGYRVARELDASLDLILVRKIGVPGQPELAAAAVVNGPSSEIVVNPDVVDELRISEDYIRERAEEELQEIERRREAWLFGRSPVDVNGRTAIVVDDGLATGATARAALLAVRRRAPAGLILAIPVAPVETLELLRPEVDRVVCLMTPSPFVAIGCYYERFDQVSEDEVARLLDRASSADPAAPPGE